MLRQHDTGWSNPKVLTILALVFICGVTVGSVVTRQYLHSRMHFRRELAIEDASRFGLRRLQQELNLTPAQEKTVATELDDYAKYYQNIEEEREDVAEHGRQRILSVLNDDQKRRFNSIFHTRTKP
jgi:hypothetical protein